MQTSVLYLACFLRSHFSCENSVLESNVFDAAAVRQVKAEIAIANGDCCAAALWDWKEFFDSVPPELLANSLRATAFPAPEASLGLQMHCAPRSFTAMGSVGATCLPSISILPGCLLSIPFTRAFLAEEIEGVGSKTEAQQSLYVDDLSHTALGSYSSVFNAICDGAVALLGASRRLRLRISSKSIVVASSERLSKHIVQHLSLLGLPVSTEKTGRDLGLCFNPTGKRDVLLRNKRLKKAEGKQAKLLPLVREVRRAGGMVRSSVLPGAFWGDFALGSPKTLLDT